MTTAPVTSPSLREHLRLITSADRLRLCFFYLTGPAVASVGLALPLQAQPNATPFQARFSSATVAPVANTDGACTVYGSLCITGPSTLRAKSTGRWIASAVELPSIDLEIHWSVTGQGVNATAHGLTLLYTFPSPGTYTITASGTVSVGSGGPGALPPASLRVTVTGSRGDNRGGATIVPVTPPSPISLGGRAGNHVELLDSGSATISATTGGTVTLPGGTSVTIPAGFLPFDQTVRVRLNSSLGQQPPSGLITSLGESVAIDMQVAGTTTATASATITALPEAAATQNISIHLATPTSPATDDADLAALASIEGNFAIQWNGGEWAPSSSPSFGDIQVPIAALLAAVDAAKVHTLGVTLNVAFSHFPGCTPSYRGGIIFDPETPASPWKTFTCATITSCKDRYLVLVHGLGSSVEKAFGECTANIQEQGQYDEIFGFDYDWTQDINKSGGQLAAFLEQIHLCCPLAQIDIEAHSEGVAVSLSALASHLTFQVPHLISLGGPILGSPAANNGINFETWMSYMDPALLLPICGTPLPQVLTSQLAADLRPNSTVLTTNVRNAILQQPGLQVIAVVGTVPGAPVSSFLNTAVFGTACNDMIVGCDSASAEGKGFGNNSISKKFQLSHIHLECDKDKEVIKWVASQIVPAPAPTVSFAASPMTLSVGDSTTLTWATANADSVMINDHTELVNGTTQSQPLLTAGPYTFTLIASGPGGTTTKTVDVTVLPANNLTATIVGPALVQVGQSNTWTAVPAGGSPPYGYSWIWSDDQYGLGPSVTRSFASPGTYTLSFTVGDTSAYGIAKPTLDVTVTNSGGGGGSAFDGSYTGNVVENDCTGVSTIFWAITISNGTIDVTNSGGPLGMATISDSGSAEFFFTASFLGSDITFTGTFGRSSDGTVQASGSWSSGSVDRCTPTYDCCAGSGTWTASN
jgi:hypothetical protein